MASGCQAFGLLVIKSRLDKDKGKTEKDKGKTAIKDQSKIRSIKPWNPKP
jgi:hypothetical protein